VELELVFTCAELPSFISIVMLISVPTGSIGGAVKCYNYVRTRAMPGQLILLFFMPYVGIKIV
jgi:hypothetical protein